MGYLNEETRLEKLAYLMMSKDGKRIDATSKSFDNFSDDDDSSDDDQLLYVMSLMRRGYSFDEDDFMFGMASEDVEELACQGIKPWDPEAFTALRVLNGDF